MKKLPSLVILGFFLFVFASTSPVYAQWLPDGNPICTASKSQLYPAITSDGAGGAIITWYDYRDVGITGADIYALRIDASGSIPDGWVEDGTPICTASRTQVYPAITSDGAGGAIITWVDWRDSGTTRSDIYALRIDAGGSIPAGWWPNGKPICTASYDQEDPKITSDSLGGAIVTWEDERDIGTTGRDIYAQRIDANGSVPAGWVAGGTPICTVSDHQENPKITSDGAGGAIITWHEWDRYSAGTSEDIFAQWIDGDGSIHAGWWPNGKSICTASDNQNDPEITSDGAGRAVIVWRDSRDSLITDFDIYAQRTGAPLGPVCEVQPTALDFDTVGVRSSKEATFTITNVGVGTLTGSVSAACGEFTISDGGGDYELPQDGWKEVTVRYEPTTVGAHICLVTTGVDCSDVVCTGHGEEAFPGQYFGTEVVDQSGTVGMYTSIAVDAAGNPHISYYSAAATALKYATKAGGLWTVEELDSPGVGLYTSLALDAYGNPHIAYHDNTSFTLKYITKADGEWLTPETVDDEGAVGADAAIALDAQGNPHVSYYDIDGGALKYAAKFGGSWLTPDTVAAGNVGRYTSIALDTQGNPHISYLDVGSGGLNYVVNRGGSWSTPQAVDNAAGSYTSIALDGQGRAHISYVDASNSKLKYVVQSPSGWETPEDLDLTEDVGSYTSLELDVDGSPHIAYYDLANGNLKYATKRGGTWEYDIVMVSGDVGQYASLALDYHGNLHVSCYDAPPNRDLLYATSAVHLTSPVGGERWRAGGQETVTWEGAGEVDILLSQDGGGTYVTLLSSVSGGIAAVQVPVWDTDAARVKIVRSSPYSTSESPDVFSIGLDIEYPWWTTTVDAPTDVGSFASLALGAGGNPHFAYNNIEDADLMYAVRTGASWAIETVDAEGNVGGTPKLALDASGNPHISYYDGDNLDSKYATKAGGVWQVETVDATDAVGAGNSIVLDAYGNPHISYWDNTNYNLKYATKAGGSWTVQTVDASGDVGASTSITIDNQGNLHISYNSFASNDLKYVRKVAGVWQTPETVDSDGSVGPWNSIALDTHGNPHISYYANLIKDLKYAVKIDGLWSTETVHASGDVGEYTSIALDGKDNPIISYYDRTNEDLKFVVKRRGFWAIESVDTTGNVGKMTSLVLDEQENPRISYHDETNQDLKYASSAIELCDPSPGAAWHTGEMRKITWNGAGLANVLISIDGGKGYDLLASDIRGGEYSLTVPNTPSQYCKVKVERTVEANTFGTYYYPASTSVSSSFFTIDLDQLRPWWATTVDSVGDVGAWASLALGPQGKPHISYAEGPPNNDLKYAVKAGGSWVTETVDASGTTGTRTSLALDAQSTPHISYYASWGALRYATKAGDVWARDTIEVGPSVGLYNSLALDAQGNPHIGYNNGTNTVLKYARKDGGSWLPPEFAATGADVGSYVSIAIDAQGNPHLSYYDGSNGLRYVTKAGGSWLTPEIVAGGDVGSFTSIAIDSKGNPCIAYQDHANLQLKYIVKVGGSWLYPAETVDTSPHGCIWTSLALDAKDTPHISYQHEVTHDLKYAAKIGDSWSTAVIDSAGDVGGYASVALDQQGNPRIAYYDETNGDLKYASAAVEVAEPSPGATWPVGASRAVTWNGAGVIDVWLSTDGGVQYDFLSGDVSNGEYMLTVPHTPSRFCKVKLERTVEANTFGTYYYPHSISVNDSFFTIETSVELLVLMAAPPQSGPGMVVSWQTDPGPEDLDSYRLEKRRGESDWFALASRTKETRYHDKEGVADDRYRLFAINGLGDELYLGETGEEKVPEFGGRLVAWPVPYREGHLNISFSTGSPEGVPIDVEVVVYDVAGRRVRTVAKRILLGGVQRVMWDGRDDRGRRVPSGVYFLQTKTALSNQTRKLVIVR
jgi:hypothetical protein